MAMAVEALNRIGERPSEKRDDAVLLGVVSEIPKLIRTGQVGIPQLNLKFDTKWSMSERSLFAGEFEELSGKLRRALNNTRVNTIVVDYFTDALGSRIPNRPDWVDVAIASQIDPIVKTLPSKVAAPYVGSSSSG